MAKFSKQDYIRIAEVIQTTFDHLLTTPNVVTWQVNYDREVTVRSFANMFEEDNGRFDRARFVAACERGL
jgi:hypothetical protein